MRQVFVLVGSKIMLAAERHAMATSPREAHGEAAPEPLAASRNVLGEPLESCGCQPMTGWFRDGSCRTDPGDLGRHTVCCVVTESFLAYTRAQGNDLSAPAPAYGFPGLKAGDSWCVCAGQIGRAHV